MAVLFGILFFGLIVILMVLMRIDLILHFLTEKKEDEDSESNTGEPPGPPSV